MTWYNILIGLVICIAVFGIGYKIASLHYDRKMKKLMVGDLFITKSEYQPYLVAKIPMEAVAEQAYVTFKVKMVDDSQK